MKKAKRAMVGKAFCFAAAGVAAYMIAQEIPAMIRYYKMTRL